MLEAYKKHPQAYFLYVEDCFLLSDAADASPTNVHPCTLFPDTLPCMSGKDEFYTKLASD